MCAAGRWLAATAIVAAAALLPGSSRPPRSRKAKRVPAAKPGNVFERQMPADVYRFMKAEFDALYPPSVRCKPGSTGCWQDQGQPTGSTPFPPTAFSAMRPIRAR